MLSCALGDVRVLDLTTEVGMYCTKLLADLGADVIRVERPGGDPVRRIGPFVEDDPHPEKSLFFFHFNTNKRSVTLDLTSEDGRRILLQLAARADVVVESGTADYLEKLGLGYEALKAVNPRIILTSMTCFGLTGPYRDFVGGDIVGTAMGGLTYLGGFPGEAPNYPAAFQGHHLVSSDAAIATLAALIQRDTIGEGQHVDVSMQEAVCNTIEFGMVLYAAQKVIRRRTGRRVYRGWNELFPCKDGFIMCSPLGGGGWRIILRWMQEKGMAADLADEKYELVFDTMADSQMDRSVTSKRKDPRVLQGFESEIAHIEQVWETFLMAHTREELFQACQTRGVRLMPLYSAEDLLNDPQLQARDFIARVSHPELGRVLGYAGAPYRLSRTPWSIRKRAPLIGEHNEEVYCRELGYSSEELRNMREAGII